MRGCRFGIYVRYIGTVEKKMETTVMGLHRVYMV